jgi:hypothetical protein
MASGQREKANSAEKKRTLGKNIRHTVAGEEARTRVRAMGDREEGGNASDNRLGKRRHAADSRLTVSSRKRRLKEKYQREDNWSGATWRKVEGVLHKIGAAVRCKMDAPDLKCAHEHRTPLSTRYVPFFFP